MKIKESGKNLFIVFSPLLYLALEQKKHYYSLKIIWSCLLDFNSPYHLPRSFIKVKPIFYQAEAGISPHGSMMAGISLGKI